MKTLAEKVEEEVGWFTTRLFRSLSLHIVPEPDYDNDAHCLRLEFTDFNAPEERTQLEQKYEKMQNYEFKKQTDGNSNSCSYSWQTIKRDLENRNCNNVASLSNDGSDDNINKIRCNRCDNIVLFIVLVCLVVSVILFPVLGFCTNIFAVSTIVCVYGNKKPERFLSTK